MARLSRAVRGKADERQNCGRIPAVSRRPSPRSATGTQYHSRNTEGTWRDIGSALIVLAHCLLLIGERRWFFVDFGNQWPGPRAFNEAKRSLRRASAAHLPSAWARINLLDQFDLSDKKLRDVLDTSP